jgi:hypothetical protein
MNLLYKTTLNNKQLLLNKNINFNFSRNYKIITDPKDISKLIFDDQGKCKIFEHKNG